MCWRNSGEAVFLEQSGHEGEREEKRARRGRAGRAGPWGLQEYSGFLLREVGALECCGQRKGGA